jgi:hypothetical protein
MSETVSCPECSRKLRLTREALGGEVRCPMCQATFFARDAGGGRAEPVAAPDAVRPLSPAWEEEDVPVSPPLEPEAVASTRGRVVRVVGGVLAVAGIPLLAVSFGDAIGGIAGAILWSMLAFVLVFLGAVGEITRPERRLFRGVGPRTVWASVLVVGYLALGCGFWFDRPSVPPADWQSFSPHEGGFRVEMPGSPTEVFWRDNNARIYCVRHKASSLTFEIGELEVGPPLRAGDGLTARGFSVVNRQYPPRDASTVKWAGVNGGGLCSYRAKGGWYVAVRVQDWGGRLFVLVVTAPHRISPDTKDVSKFFSSLGPIRKKTLPDA